MMLYLIYFTLYILSYRALRSLYRTRKDSYNDWNWVDVVKCAVISISLIVPVIYYLDQAFLYVKSYFKHSKPPKWL